MISEFVQLLQEAETSDINSRIRHLLVELLNSTAAENIDALFRLCRHLLSTRPSLFETQNDDQCVVKVLRKKCAAYGDHELCRLIDLHMPFTVPRLGDILDGPNDEVHGGKSSVPQLGARKRRREDSEASSFR
jgi:hypothetical protein